MKRLGWIAALGLLACGVTTDAFAWSVAVDVPVSYTLKSAAFTANGDTPIHSKDAASVSGYKVALKLPFFLGLAYEDYKVGFNIFPANPPAGVTNLKALSTFRIYDLFVELPFHSVHLGLGAGMGEAKGDTDPPLGAAFKSAAVSQYFATLGLPIGSVLDVHVGYHVVSVADMAVSPPSGTPDKLHLSGNMLSVGVRLGY